MKKIFTFLSILLCTQLFAQDTTSLRMIAVSSGMELDYFYDDSTSMGDKVLSGSSGHAIFVNPGDSLLYAILDVNGADRNLYKINPFTGALTLFFNFTDGYINTGDIDNDGSVFAMVGNGSGNNGRIYRLDMSTKTESVWTQSIVDDARALEFNPADSSLFIYEGFSDSVYSIKTATKVEIGARYTAINDEIHGAYYDEGTNKFLLSAYGGEMYRTTTNWYTLSMYHDMDNGVSGNNVMDLTMFPIKQTVADSMTFCPGDSQMIRLLYDVNNIRWFVDNKEITGQRDSFIYAKDAGVYRALIPIGMSSGTNYMWSEPTVVTHLTSPNVSIKSASGDSTICQGDSLQLIGVIAGGGSTYWSYNGALIPGSSGLVNIYANATGTYNQIKTNTSGCVDSMPGGFIVYDVALPISTVSSSDTLICDGETIQISGSSTGSLQWYKDGTVISGATSSTYGATEVGRYNMTGTNACGVPDSAVVPVIIYEDSCADDTTGIIDYQNASVKIYPVPVGDVINIVSPEKDLSSLRLMDLRGVMVAEYGRLAKNQSIQINVSGLEPGVYIVEMLTGDNQRILSRIVKE